MRSRYSAYALGLVDYILLTTHPAGPKHQSDEARWRAEAQWFADHTRFKSLSVISVESGDEVGFVTFHAELEQDGQDASFGERSRFEKLEGRWLYHSGDRI